MPTITIDNVTGMTATSGNGVSSVTLTTTASGGVRIECGSTAPFTDTSGNVWSADQYFAAGSIVDRGAIAIANTNDDRIYQTERWGLTGYSIPVENGTYTVRLHFAETWSGITGPGQRLFSVAIGGVTALTNFDVFATAGNARNTAVIREFQTTVSNGTLGITFTRNANEPMINGIEVL